MLTVRRQWRRRLPASKIKDAFCPRTQRIYLIRRSDSLLLFQGYRPVALALCASRLGLAAAARTLERAEKAEEAPISLIYCTDRQYLCRL